MIRPDVGILLQWGAAVGKLLVVMRTIKEDGRGCVWGCMHERACDWAGIQNMNTNRGNIEGRRVTARTSSPMGDMVQ